MIGRLSEEEFVRHTEHLRSAVPRPFQRLTRRQAGLTEAIEKAFTPHCRTEWAIEPSVRNRQSRHLPQDVLRSSGTPMQQMSCDKEDHHHTHSGIVGPQIRRPDKRIEYDWVVVGPLSAHLRHSRTHEKMAQNAPKPAIAEEVPP